MTKMEIFTRSLEKKKQRFDDKLAEHIECVKSTNGQPLNDKRNGQRTLNQWDKQNDALRNLDKEVKKTEDAIERESDKISDCNYWLANIPNAIASRVKSGELTQWRKYPNIFFVIGIEKARLAIDRKTGQLSHSYASYIPTAEQRTIFKTVYNTIYAEINTQPFSLKS